MICSSLYLTGGNADPINVINKLLNRRGAGLIPGPEPKWHQPPHVHTAPGMLLGQVCVGESWLGPVQYSLSPAGRSLLSAINAPTVSNGKCSLDLSEARISHSRNPLQMFGVFFQLLEAAKIKVAFQGP